MKYILEYEKLNRYDDHNYYNYKIKDYVYIKDIYHLYKLNSTPYTRIIGIDNNKCDDTQVQLPNGYSVWIRSSMIERILTSEEIEKYELEKSTYKYNL